MMDKKEEADGIATTDKMGCESSINGDLDKGQSNRNSKVKCLGIDFIPLLTCLMI